MYSWEKEKPWAVATKPDWAPGTVYADGYGGWTTKNEAEKYGSAALAERKVEAFSKRGIESFVVDVRESAA